MEYGKIKVLIVDDAGPVIVLCVNVLQSIGYSVRGANSGERALELIREEPFDLMLVDYRMPGMDGFEVFKRARAMRPDMATVLVTAYGTPEILKGASEMGFNAVLPKPFTPADLRGVVDKALAGKALGGGCETAQR